MKFNQTLDGALDAADLTWQIEISLGSSSKTTTLELSGIDLNNLDSVATSLFEQFIILAGDTYSFNGTQILADTYFAGVEAALDVVSSL